MGESIWKSVITYPNTDTTIIISIILFTLEMKRAKKNLIIWKVEMTGV
jgi:hypothetical protein